VSLKILYKPDNELLAIRIRDLLEQEGIESILHSYQMPWYDGLAKMMRPEWGEVLVQEDDFERAREVLTDLLETLKSEAEPEGEMPSEETEEEKGPD
jgi:hypothetical protein